MPKRSFTVRALWDSEAGVYYSESDIIGLHIEAETIDEFEAVMLELAPELIVTNHLELGEEDSISATRLAQFMPTIVWQRPEHAMA